MSVRNRQVPDTGKPALQAQQSLLQRTWLGALLLVVVVFGAYHNSLHGPFIFDDFDSIPENASIRDWRTLFSPPSASGVTVSGRPVLNASFALNWQLSGDDVTGIHVTNTLIHLLAALLLWGVIRRTLERCTTSADGSKAAVAAWFAAALWAVHPLQTESVTYMVQRAESLVGLFYLLTLYGFIRATGNGGWCWRVVAVAACVLGMGTKEVMATAPLVILVYDRVIISGSFKEAWRRHGGLHSFLWATLLLLALLVFQGGRRGGSVGVTTADMSWWDYVCTQAVAIVRYVRLSLWPAHLTLDYGTWIARDPLVIIPCAAVIMVALAWTLRALTRGMQAGLAGLWFFAILAPSSSVVPVATQTMAEHRMYLPLASLCVAVVLTVRRWMPRGSSSLLAGLVLAGAVMTIQRNEAYRTARSIWQDTVAKAPENSRALNNLGAVLLIDDKNAAAALPFLEKAQQLAPAFPEASSNLGQALVKLGRRDEGLRFMERSLQLAPGNKRLHAGYGSALMDAGEPQKAVEHLQIALESGSQRSSTHYNLANALMKLGRLQEAEPHFRKTLETEPDDLDVLNNYGTLLRRLGRPQEAISLFTHAIALAPDSAKAHNNLGVAYAAVGRSEESILHLQTALRLEPKSVETRSNLAGALAQAGRVDEAIAETEAVLHERPDADLFNNLGGLYGQSGRLPQAEAAFREALRLDPNHEGARENLGRLRAYLEAQGGP